MLNVAKPQLKSESLVVYSHNSHRVWEWSKVNSKANFVAWKNYMLIAFRNEYYLAYIFFHFELQKVYLNRDNAGKNLERFETSRLNSTETFSLSEIAHVMWCMHSRAVRTMVAIYEIGRPCALAEL